MELNLRFTTELTLRKFNIRKLNNMHLNKLMDHKKKLKKKTAKYLEVVEEWECLSIPSVNINC